MSIEKVKKILLHKDVRLEFAGLMVPFDHEDRESIYDLKICLYVSIDDDHTYDLFLDLHERFEEDMVRKYTDDDFELDKHLIYGFYDFNTEEYIYKKE